MTSIERNSSFNSVDTRVLRIAELSLNDAKIVSSGAVPAIAGGAGAAIDASSTDTAGSVSGWDNSGSSDVTITFSGAAPAGQSPIVLLTHVGTESNPLVVSSDETGFVVSSSVASAGLGFNYLVVFNQ